jgi:hypothetical protein
MIFYSQRKHTEMPNEAPKRLNSTLLDTTVLNALRKFATTATQQGRTDRATLALELLSRFDKKNHQNIVAQHRKTDDELLAALQTYHAAVASQNRADRILWANETFAALHTDAVADLRDEFNTRIAELEKQIAAVIAKKR